MVADRQVSCLSVEFEACWHIRLLHQVIDHALQAHGPAVIGVVNAGDAVLVQPGNFIRQDGTPASTEDADMACPLLLQQVVHVSEVFVVPALVARHGDGLRIFLNGAVDHLFDTAVVAQVNNLAAG